MLSTSERTLTCRITALVTTLKFRDAGNEAATGTGIIGLPKPRMGGGLTKEQKPSLGVACATGSSLGRLCGNPRVGKGDCVSG